MKNLLNTVIICLIFFSLKLNAQTPCLPNFGGIEPTDDPPGCLVCSSVFLINNAHFTPGPPGDVLFPCGTIENNFFLSIIPDSTGNIGGTILSSNCRDSEIGLGVQMMVFDQNFEPVSNCLPGHFGNFAVYNLSPGETYWMMIDGFAGDICDLRITFDIGLFFDVPGKVDTIFTDNSTLNLCWSDEACYFIKPVSDAQEYFWEIPQNSKIISGGGLKDTFVCLKFFELGIDLVSVAPRKTCAAEKTSMTTSVRKITTRLDELICPGDSFQVGNQFFETEGSFQVVFDDRGANCDSTVYLNLRIPDTSAVKIQCVADTFLQTIDINWEERRLATEYQVFINDSLFSTQHFEGFIYHSNFSEEEINIEIRPFGTHHCNYSFSKETCRGPILTSSTAEINSQELSIFPNPSEDFFRIFSKKRPDRIEVFDLKNRLKTFSKTNQIDLSDFPPGIYFLKIQIGQEWFLEKVLKN